MFITSFEEQNITYRSCSNLRIHLYTTKTPITSADLLNDRVLPFYQSQDLPMLRILKDRGTEYCGKVEQHDYVLYLAVNDIEGQSNSSSITWIYAVFSLVLMIVVL